MGKTTGFLEYDRMEGPVRPEAERIKDFDEFHGSLSLEERKKQAARCMDCGIPFCQAGVMISHMASGCPLHNLVPEVNDLVYRGLMEAAYRRLAVTHSFPEFTSRVCPALCEAACTCGLGDEPVATKENEKAVIEYAFAHGLVEEGLPAVRTGKKVAVVGSGPAGLAAAQMLNRKGHEVTVYERHDRVGGLLRYGIPNMKLDKAVIDRRVGLMEAAGVRFVLNTDVGKDLSAEQLLDEYDRITIYSTRARNGEYGGRVMSVEVWNDPEEEPYDGMIPYKKIGIKDGHLIFVTYASDIQYDINDEAAADEYMAIRNEAETVQEGGKSGPLILK